MFITERLKINKMVVLFRAGMLKVAGTQEVELAWEPPKGDFTKYVLSGK
jgi:hypothetical protein